MAKQLKKVEYNAEDEAKFRSRLAYAKVEKVKHDPIEAVKFPEEFSGKTTNKPWEFSSRLKSNDSNKINLEFIKYMYGKYKVPHHMDAAWHYTPPTVEANVHNRYGRNRNQPPVRRVDPDIYDYKSWWLCIATGGSLYKDYCKEFLTKKEVHTFINCPHDITLNQTVTYSIALCYGASMGDALRIAKSKLSTKRLNNDIPGKFWREVIQFFAMNTPEKIKDIDDLLDFVWAKYNENLSYTILGQGLTVASLTVKMKNWHYELARIKVMGDSNWEGFAMEDFTYEVEDEYKNLITWTITQIKTAKALAAEGNAMHHCVYSYRDRCRKGDISIWSVQSCFKGMVKRRVTIELDNFKSIRQSRGFANRDVKSDERAIILKWCGKEFLSWNTRW